MMAALFLIHNFGSSTWRRAYYLSHSLPAEIALRFIVCLLSVALTGLIVSVT